MLSLDATNAVRMAARQLAEAREREMQVEHERPVRKLEAIARIMQFPNVLNDKAHSASSAEAVVETDAEYAAYLGQCRQAVLNVIRARAEYEIAVSTMRSAEQVGVAA